MEELNFFLILILIISVFMLHGKLNRIEKLLKPEEAEKDKKSPPAAEKKRVETPIAPPEIAAPAVKDIPQAEEKTAKNEIWEKFRYWFCYGIQRNDVSKEYAAATTWLIRFGIIILLCAVGFFLKYSIENNLVSPTVRIILTFIAASGMFMIGLAGLNKRFHILAIGILSAGVVTFYMGAFAGFKLYHIIPVGAAFAVMVLTTAVSMLAAVKFNLLPIALIGCAGGYLTPVMLSNNSGNLLFLLCYIAVISAGVLIASRVYRWRSLEAAALVLSYVLIDRGMSALANKITLYCLLPLFINFIVFSMIPVIRKKETKYGLTEWLLPILSCAATLFIGIYFISTSLNSEYEKMLQSAWAVLLAAITLSEGVYLLKKRHDCGKVLPAFLAASIVSLATAVPLALENEGSIASCWSLLAFGLIFAYGRSNYKTLLVLGSIIFAGAFFVMMTCPYYVFEGDMVSRFFRGGVLTAALLASGFVLLKSNENSAQKAKKIFFTLGGIAFLVYSSVEVYRNLEKCQLLHDFRHGGLSVWWAVVACALLVAGIRKNYRVLRASSLILFVGCLAKIYMVDIAGLNTLHKVIAFLLTGILFLGGAAAYIIFRKRFSEDKK